MHFQIRLNHPVQRQEVVDFSSVVEFSMLKKNFSILCRVGMFVVPAGAFVVSFYISRGNLICDVV